MLMFHRVFGVAADGYGLQVWEDFFHERQPHLNLCLRHLDFPLGVVYQAVENLGVRNFSPVFFWHLEASWSALLAGHD